MFHVKFTFPVNGKTSIKVCEGPSSDGTFEADSLDEAQGTARYLACACLISGHRVEIDLADGSESVYFFDPVRSGYFSFASDIIGCEVSSFHWQTKAV